MFLLSEIIMSEAIFFWADSVGPPIACRVSARFSCINFSSIVSTLLSYVN